MSFHGRKNSKDFQGLVMAQAETKAGGGAHCGGTVSDKPIVGWNKEKVCMMDKSLNEHTNFCARDVDLKTNTAASFCAHNSAFRNSFLCWI